MFPHDVIVGVLSNGWFISLGYTVPVLRSYVSRAHPCAVSPDHDNRESPKPSRLTHMLSLGMGIR
jgi:hypothetical protein